MFSSCGDKQMLIRGIGPSLAQFGVTGALSDVKLELFRGQTVIANNANWSLAPNPSGLSAIASRLGAFGLADNSRDAALLVSLDPGAYTVSANCE
jgi:hypothetical protein